MATGDALQVGIAAPFVNWRGERDYQAGALGGAPDGWGVAGSASLTWRQLLGSTDTYVRQWGLGSLGGLGLYSAAAGDYAWCRTLPNAVPALTMLDGVLFAWVCPWSSSSDRIAVQVHLLNAAGTSEGSGAANSSSSLSRAKWGAMAVGSPTMLATTSMIQARFVDSGASGTPTRMILSEPVFVWHALGSTGGPRSMTAHPSANGTTLVPKGLGELSRGDSGSMSYADPYGASAKWTLTLSFEDMPEADYNYWCACYAVNRGASGYKGADGKRLEPQPVAVLHHFWEPTDYSGTPSDHYRNAGKPQIIVGNIVSFDLRVREYLGWGYSGSIVIEEA